MEYFLEDARGGFRKNWTAVFPAASRRGGLSFTASVCISMSCTINSGVSGRISRSVWAARLTRAEIRILKTAPYARSKPDLRLHVPGYVENNLACVEVSRSIGQSPTLHWINKKRF
jgi:hypothetical protein